MLFRSLLVVGVELGLVLGLSMTGLSAQASGTFSRTADIRDDFRMNLVSLCDANAVPMETLQQLNLDFGNGARQVLVVNGDGDAQPSLRVVKRHVFLLVNGDQIPFATVKQIRVACTPNGNQTLELDVSGYIGLSAESTALDRCHSISPGVWGYNVVDKLKITEDKGETTVLSTKRMATYNNRECK